MIFTVVNFTTKPIPSSFPEKMRGLKFIHYLHFLRCCQCNKPFTLSIHRTVKMVYHTVILNYPIFVCMDIFPFLLGLHQRLAVPHCPIHKVIGTGKCIKCTLAIGNIPEKEHNIYIAHSHYLWVTGYSQALDFVKIIYYRLVTVALPMLAVIGNRKKNSLPVSVGLCIVGAYIPVSEGHFLVYYHIALVNCERFLFPCICILWR